MSRISGPDDGERRNGWNCCCGGSVMVGGLMTLLTALAVRRKGKKR